MTVKLSIPDEIPILRNSERSSFKRCPAAWHWGWQRGLKPNNARQDARWYGTCLHLALAEHYTPPKGKDGFTRGRNLNEIWEEITQDVYVSVYSGNFDGEDQEKNFFNAKQLGHAMLAGYKEKWGNDDHWEILMPEWRFSTAIPYNPRQRASIPERTFDFITRLVGTFDMPVRDHSFPKPTIVVVDHKSTGKKMDFKMLTKDDQAGTYITIATNTLRNRELIGKGESVQGAVFNYLRKSMPKDDAVRDELGRVRNKPKKEHYLEAFAKLPGFTIDPKTPVAQLEKIASEAEIQVFGEVSKNQGVELFWRIPVMRSKGNRMRQLARIADDAEMIERVRTGELPVLKTPGEHCNWCDFNNLCDVDENGGDTEQFIKDAFTVVDMYADHRTGAVNSKEGLQSALHTNQL